MCVFFFRVHKSAQTYMCAFQNGKGSLTPARNYPKFGVGGEKFPDFFPSFFFFFCCCIFHFHRCILACLGSRVRCTYLQHMMTAFLCSKVHMCVSPHTYTIVQTLGCRFFFCGPLIVVLERGWWVVQQGGGLGGIVSPGTKSLSFHCVIHFVKV